MFPGIGDTVREPQWLWAAVIGWILVLSSWRQLILIKGAMFSCGWAVFLGGWILYLAARAVFSPRPLGAFFILAFPLAVALGAFAILSGRGRYKEQDLYAVLMAITVLQFGIGSLQMLGLDPLFTRGTVKGLSERLPAGFLGQHTFYGLFMAWLGWIWIVNRKYLLAFVSVLAMLAAKSAFALASFFFALLWFVWCRGWKKSSSLLALAGFLGGAFLFLYGDDHPGFFSHNGRLHIWVYSINAIAEQPWLGYGVGEFSREFPAYHQVLGDMRWEEAHNELIEYVFNVGILGLLAVIPFLGSVLVRAWRLPMSKEKEIAVGTLLILGVNSMGNFPLQLAPFALLGIYSVVWILLAGPDHSRL